MYSGSILDPFISSRPQHNVLQHTHLHGIDNLLANHNQTDNDNRATLAQPAVFHQGLERGLNSVLRIEQIKWHHKWRDCQLRDSVVAKVSRSHRA